MTEAERKQSEGAYYAGIKGIPAEVIERGNRFRFNLCWVLRAEGWTWRDLGEIAWGSDGPCGDAARRRVLRLVNGDVRLTLQDLERFAALLAIPAAVLAYGTPAQLEASWASSRLTISPPIKRGRHG